MTEHWKAALAGAVIAISGVFAGMQLTGALAEAQTDGYRECFFGQQEVEDIDSEGRPSRPSAAHTILVPSGYEVVSGGGNARVDHGTILFCRR